MWGGVSRGRSEQAASERFVASECAGNSLEVIAELTRNRVRRDTGTQELMDGPIG